MASRAETSETRKTLSQNFLRRGPVVSEFVARTGIDADDVVVEIGGGSGVITEQLAGTGARVTVVERDPRYAEELRTRFANVAEVRVLETDVRDFRWPDEPFRAVGNIPFGLTTGILRILLERVGPELKRADLIVQADVARKREGQPEGNKLNLVWAPWWRFELGQLIRADAFSPRPRVNAAVLVVTRRRRPLLAPEAQRLWTGLIETAFSRGSQPVRRSLADVLTSTQLQRVSAGQDWDRTTLTSRIPLDGWLAIYAVVEQYVPRERWPLSVGQPARRSRPPQRERRDAPSRHRD